MNNKSVTVVGFTRIAVNFKFHSWFANFKFHSWFANFKLTYDEILKPQDSFGRFVNIFLDL